MRNLLGSKDLLSETEGVEVTCGACESKSAEIRWDKRYSGFRGFCNACKNNWPES